MVRVELVNTKNFGPNWNAENFQKKDYLEFEHCTVIRSSPMIEKSIKLPGDFGAYSLKMMMMTQ